jgi:uncharacterized protein (DUF58 family)
MVPTHLSKGLIIVGIILLWFALFFNSAIAMISAVATLLVIQWRLYSFQHDTKEILAGIVCNRDVPANFIRAGLSVEVRLSIRISLPGRFQAVVQEKVSPGMVIQKGNLEFSITGEKTEQLELVYIVAPMVHGILSFPGLMIRLTDPFFSDEIHLLNDHFNGPVLKVFPSGSYELNLESYEYGEQEIERIRARSGVELSGFRQYVPGDDMKHIDWKMTAKHGKPVVRQYTGIGGTNPLIILDLPEQVENAIPVHFHTMVRAVSGAIEESWKKYRKSSFVLISGPNIIESSRPEGGVEQSLAILNASAYPLKRARSFYRFQTKGAMRAISNEISKVKVTNSYLDAQEYLENIGSVITSFQKDPQAVPVFHGEISKLLTMWPHDTVIIFSLCSGDMSHIGYLIEQVHYDNGTVHLHVPANNVVPGFMRNCIHCGADIVKVFS